jgi:uncharacterized delta-60 repeat protein
LTTFDCTNCLFDNQPNYLISGGTPTMVGPDTCGRYNFGYTMSGCNDTFLSTDFYKYVFFSDNLNAQPENFFYAPQTKYRLDIGPTQYFTPTGITPQLGLGQFYHRFYSCSVGCYNDSSTFPNLCINPPNTNYIRYTKFNTGLGGTGIFKMYFSDISDASFYWSKIQTARNVLLLSTPIYSTNSTDFGFYKQFSIRIPGGTAVGDTPCGDGNIPIYFYFHLSSVVTSGFTGGYYEIELTMPTIPNDLVNSNCNGCRSIAQSNICNFVNNSSTGFTTDITSNTGSRYVYIWDACDLRPQVNSVYELVHQTFLSIPKYFNNTYMYSGTPYSYLPSLTTELCDYTNEMTLKRLTTFPISSDNYYWERIIFKYHTYILNQLKYFARVNTDGSLDSLPNYQFGLNPEAAPLWGAIEQPSNQYILYGVYIDSYNFTQTNGIIRIDSDGTLDTTFQTNIGTGLSGTSINNQQPGILTHATQADGKILLGGAGFSGFSSNFVNQIFRINSNGTYDPSFNVTFNVVLGILVRSIVVQPDQQILVSGNFQTVNGDTTKKYLVRLNPNGSVDSSFTAVGLTNVGIITLQPDGKILVGVTQGSLLYLHRRNSNGSLDTAFNNNLGTGFFGVVSAIVIQPTDQKILVGGEFTSFNGDTTKKYLVRLNTDGTIDTSFNLGSGFIGLTSIYTIKVDSFGGIYVGGIFSSFNYQPYGNIIKLTPTGSVDTTFNSGGGFISGVPYSIDIDSNNKLIITGNFNSYDNYPSNFPDFGIYTYSLDKGEYMQPAFPIYKYSGGTVIYSDPAYII